MLDRRKLKSWIPVTILALIVVLYTYETYVTFGGIQAYIGDEVWYPTAAYNYLKIIFHVRPPMYFPYSTENNIQTYLNPDHPPLGKYFMDIFILLMGYQPIAWRIPSWIIGDLIIITGYFLGKRLYEKAVGDKGLSWVAGLLSSIVIMSDPSVWILHGIAMLDIYVSAFVLLSLYFLMDGRYLLASITLGLAFASKESSYFLLFPYLWYIGDVFKSVKMRTLYGVIIPLITYGIVASPLIYYYGGPYQWVKATILHEATWDTQNGHISLTATSQISTPLDWFFNINPFSLGHGFYASTDPIVLITAAILTFLFIIIKDKTLLYVSSWGWIMWFSFLVVYILGNHTLFSFYVVDFSPIFDVMIVPGLFSVVNRVTTRKKLEAQLPPNTPNIY